MRYAQIAHDLEIYAENGLKFTLTLNGRVMNEEPVIHIQILNTNKDQIHAIINFEDTSIPPIERKFLQLANPGTNEYETNKPVDVVYKIIKKKGKYKLWFASRSNKKIQSNTTIIVTEGEQNGVGISNGRLVIRW